MLVYTSVNNSDPKLHITANSKKVKVGSTFYALPGVNHDGHEFIAEALSAGAVQVFSEKPFSDPRVQVVANIRAKFTEAINAACGYPTKKLKMIGVTGTSGKTTTTFLIHHCLNSAGRTFARIGTTGFFFLGQETKTNNTTPDPEILFPYFQGLVEQGAEGVVMEVSSHALSQYRVRGIEWDFAVFLNLSPEHLDYHPTLEDYFQAKALLFQPNPSLKTSCTKHTRFLANADDSFGRRLPSINPDVQLYSAQSEISGVVSDISGIRGQLLTQGSQFSFSCPMVGDFQPDNILATARVVSDLIPIDLLIRGLASFEGVPGRMQNVPMPDSIPPAQQFRILVDYAHKPEALQKVLSTLRRIQDQTGRKLICVFGCGGDRDQTKRPVMGAISAKLADITILTSDNPRTESADAILDAIETGAKSASPLRSKIFRNADRTQAIHQAISIAEPGDCVLIAGKGHETEQIIGKLKIPFDDRLVARNALSARFK